MGALPRHHSSTMHHHGPLFIHSAAELLSLVIDTILKQGNMTKQDKRSPVVKPNRMKVHLSSGAPPEGLRRRPEAPI